MGGSGMITCNSNALVTLRAAKSWSGATSPLARTLHMDCGDLRVDGLVGPGPVELRFSEYVDQVTPPEVIEFVRACEVFDLVYRFEATRPGDSDREGVAVACRLRSAALVETPNDGTRLAYVLTADRLEGIWFPGDRR